MLHFKSLFNICINLLWKFDYKTLYSWYIFLFISSWPKIENTGYNETYCGLIGGGMINSTLCSFLCIFWYPCKLSFVFYFYRFIWWESDSRLSLKYSWFYFCIIIFLLGLPLLGIVTNIWCYSALDVWAMFSSLLWLYCTFVFWNLVSSK